MFVSLQNKDFVVVLATSNPKVTFSVPHDGLSDNFFEGALVKRTSGSFVRDMHLAVFGQTFFKELVRLNVGSSYVRMLLPRNICDANRAMYEGQSDDVCTSHETAFTDERVRPYYLKYYNEIQKAVLHNRELLGDASLHFDLHGFSKQPSYAGEGFDIVLGTANRQTVLGSNIDKRLGNFLRDAGYRVFVPAKNTVRTGVSDDYDAGWTTRCVAKNYGGIAVQIEIDRNIRLDKDRSERLASKLAKFVHGW